MNHFESKIKTDDKRLTEYKLGGTQWINRLELEKFYHYTVIAELSTIIIPKGCDLSTRNGTVDSQVKNKNI